VTPQHGGYGAPPQQGYGAPPQQQGYGSVQGYQAKPQTGYGTTQTGYGAPPQQSGYGTTQGYGVQPPQQQNSQLSQWFNAVDKDHSGSISSYELRNALSQSGLPFDEDVARKMVRMFDRDGNGTIDFNEFCSLHAYLTQMKGAFYAVDTDKSGFLDYQEVERAVQQAGYRLNQMVLQKIFRQFDTLKQGKLNFDGYIKLCIYLGTVRQIFQVNDKQRNGTAMFSFDAFTDACLLFMQ
jgi:Ca2+-binding EF-hand superfamily protein